MEIFIREAVERDYEDLCEIIDQVDKLHRDRLPRRFRAAEGPARTWDYISNAIHAPDVGLFVAEIEGALVGFVHIVVREAPDIPILVPRRYGVIDNLAVEKVHQRSGVGRALMERAHAWAKGKGATSIELRVYAFNQPAMHFYRDLGYQTVSHHMSKPLETAERECEDGDRADPAR
jgi:GNAT superfamily N-acetyltransferase